MKSDRKRNHLSKRRLMKPPERLGGILTDTLELFDSSFVNRMDIENLLNNLN